MSDTPFDRDRAVDKPGIVGARWWHTSLADEDAKVARRTAITAILIGAGALAGVGAMVAALASGSSSSPSLPEDAEEKRTSSLEMQRGYGWNFGAVGEGLVFDGATEKPFEVGALDTLPEDLRPAQSELVPYYQPTLFQSPAAIPTSLGKLPPDEAAGFKPLSEALKPIATPAMEAAYVRGKSFASLFASLADDGGTTTAAKTAVIVDLPGPEAVAFAAGAARVFDPVFLFDNWPHPRGVVHAHETLAAAAYYQPLFKKEQKLAKRPMPPMFVLDRRRLTAYTDDATQFDNRYTAKLPTPTQLRDALQIAHVLYVVPTRADALIELDDLNDDFCAFLGAVGNVKSLSLDMFSAPSPAAAGGASALGTADAGGKGAVGGKMSDALVAESGNVWYGGSPESHHSFFVDYPWAQPARKATMRAASNPGTTYVPTPRTTAYSTGAPLTSSAGSGTGATGGNTSSWDSTRARPTNFGTVPIIVAAGTGALLGARYSRRNGSWNRAAGGWGG